MPEPWITDRVAAARGGGAAEIFRYPAVGHLLTDASIDYDAEAGALQWERESALLASL